MKQIYGKYKEEDFEVWNLLFNRQMAILPGLASTEYLEGIKKTNFSADKIPDFLELNQILREQTGWSLEVVPGIIPEREFFPLLANKKFPATTWLRKKSQLDYLEEPDMFHDVFGHVPLLTNKHFCDFFEALGELGVKYLENEKVISMLGRIYWFTVEFGLIRENSTVSVQARDNTMPETSLRIYGAGILSSHGETKFCLSDVPAHLPFDTLSVMNTPFQNDRIQDKYFIIDSFEQLYNSIGIIINTIENGSVVA